MLVNLLLVLAFLAAAFAEKSGVTLNWKSVAIDASGKYQAAVAAYNKDLKQGYPIYLSDDYGANWRQSKSSQLDWRNIYLDSTGQNLVGYAAYDAPSFSYPPLQISKDRGNTWENGVATTMYVFNNDIKGSNSSLYTVMSNQVYSSSNLGKGWAQITKIINSKGTYALVGSASFDAEWKNRYVTCDGVFCASHDSGRSYTTSSGLPATSVETDATGQYVFILTDKYLQYSSDYATSWKVLKDFTVSGSPVVTSTFLKISSDHQYVYMLQKASSTSSTTNLVRFNVSSKISTTIFSTSNAVNDVAISATGSSIIVSTTANLFYTTSNSGSTWMTHIISV